MVQATSTPPSVVIVGAGPSGLVAALSLAQHGVKSIILEREREIAQDPRGVYLAADAVRILSVLGLGPRFPFIGHELHQVQFHQSSFKTPPFHGLDLTGDDLQQAVPTGLLQMQPRLESVLRDAALANELCDLRLGAEVQEIAEADNGTRITYRDADGTIHTLAASWLIGADGKRGVVRKTFLERVADVRQVHSNYRYEGTWVAANLKMTLPTRESHPDLAVWKAGLSPQEVYDLFWPVGWHFCSPPGKATAAGRFGPHDQHLWRHEFVLADSEVDGCDAEAMLWEQLTPMITRREDATGKPFAEPVTFPRDCIEILRCRPFTFTHKIVNRWFYKKCVLIGDAAHVFPPFGGQGIASGIRDAHQLAWRIALLERLAHPTADRIEQVLQGWAQERVHSVRAAAAITRVNGLLCNNNLYYPVKIVQACETWLQWIFGPSARIDPQQRAEAAGLRGAAGGCFLAAHGGGTRIPQIYWDGVQKTMLLSDHALISAHTIFTLLIFVDGNQRPRFDTAAVKALLSQHSIPETVLSLETAAFVSRTSCIPESIGDYKLRTTRKFAPSPLRRLNHRQARAGYDPAAFEKRLGRGVTFAIVRPDFFVFATAKNLSALSVCLARLREVLGC